MLAILSKNHSQQLMSTIGEAIKAQVECTSGTALCSFGILYSIEQYFTVLCSYAQYCEQVNIVLIALTIVVQSIVIDSYINFFLHDIILCCL